MMNTETALTHMILFFTSLIVMFYVLRSILIQRLPFTYDTDSYVKLKNVIKCGTQWIANTLVAFTVTGISYHTIKTSFPKISDFKNEEIGAVFIIMLSIMIIGLSWKAILLFGRFLNYLFLYFSLKKNNISNNLKHALANRNEKAIIENYKLLIQTDEIVNISSDEMLILSACLSKYGYNDDVKELLEHKLYKKQSLLNKFFSTNTHMIEYNVKGLPKDFVPRSTFKHKKKRFENITTIISYIMTIMFVVQFVITTFSEAFHIPNTLMLIFVALTSIIIIALILIKYKKFKKIYIKELEVANLTNNHIKISKPIVENILLGLSVFMIANAIVQVLFF